MMKTKRCKMIDLLGCALIIFTGKALACGCDVVDSKKTALTVTQGQYEIDLGRLSAEPEPAANHLMNGTLAADQAAAWERGLASIGMMQQLRGCSADMSAATGNADTMAQEDCAAEKKML
jgi:hypothetical protein